MKANFKKNWWIYLIVGVLVCALAGGIIYACVAASNDGKVKTKKISASEFSLGGLDANGKYVETKESIYTKDAFQCQGLTVTPEFESQVTYQIFFYDELGEFVEKTASLEKAYRDDIPAGAFYARIVITPNAKEDGTAVTMNVFNKSKYAKQLTITVNKEQKTFLEQIKALDNQAVLLGTGIFDADSGTFSSSSSSPFYFFSPVDVSNTSVAYIYLKTESLTNMSTFSSTVVMDATQYYDDNGTVVPLNTQKVVYENGGYSYVSLDVSDLNELWIFTDEVSSQVLGIYLA